MRKQDPLLFEKIEGFQAAVLLEIFLQEKRLKWPESRFFLRTFPPHTRLFCQEECQKQPQLYRPIAKQRKSDLAQAKQSNERELSRPD